MLSFALRIIIVIANMEQHWYLENRRGKYASKIKEERINFFFLNDGTMVYPYEKFDSYWDAMIDAIKKGENMDELIALVFPEKVDHPIVKEKLLNYFNIMKTAPDIIYPIGTKVCKKSGKPFKSMFKINTISGIVEHPYKKDNNGKGVVSYTFYEDSSIVEAIMVKQINCKRIFCSGSFPSESYVDFGGDTIQKEKILVSKQEWIDVPEDYTEEQIINYISNITGIDKKDIEFVK